MAYKYHTHSNYGLKREWMERVAPAIFSEAAKEGLSDQYVFTPTIAGLDALKTIGYSPVTVMQSAAHTPDGKQVAAQLIRLRHERDLFIKGKYYPRNYLDNKNLCEIVISTDHQGLRSWRAYFGYVRGICTNELIFGDFLNSVRLAHRHTTPQTIVEATMKLAASTQEVLAKINELKARKLTATEKVKFADYVRDLRWGNSKKKPNLYSMLNATRDQDNYSNAWTVGNIIQEKATKGFTAQDADTGDWTEFKAMRGVNDLVKVNTGIWEYASNLL